MKTFLFMRCLGDNKELSQGTKATRRKLHARQRIFGLLIVCILCVVFINLQLSTTNSGNGSVKNYAVLSRNVKKSSSSIKFETQINPHKYGYLILEDKICDYKNNGNVTVYLLVVVFVSTRDFQKRRIIRNTWGSTARQNKEIKLVFMLGSTNDYRVQQQVQKESMRFNDILQGSFTDTYMYLSFKSVAMLKFAFTYCPSAKFVLKADDDAFVNLRYLMKVLKNEYQFENGGNFIIGSMVTNATPVRSKYSRYSKYFTPYSVYNESFYPPYCLGTSYLVSGDCTMSLYQHAMSYIPTALWEDVLITGICRIKAGAKIINDVRISFHDCMLRKCNFVHMISGQYKTDEIRKKWIDINIARDRVYYI